MNVVQHPEPILLTEAAEVTPEEISSAEFQKTLDSMEEKLFSLNALGLAAPQIGIGKKLFVYRTPGHTCEVLINAKIVSCNDRVTHHGEGCLSVPGNRYDIKRYKRITVEGLNRQGEKVNLRVSNKMLAFCIQHEIDHCNGITVEERGTQTHVG